VWGRRQLKDIKRTALGEQHKRRAFVAGLRTEFRCEQPRIYPGFDKPRTSKREPNKSEHTVKSLRTEFRRQVFPCGFRASLMVHQRVQILHVESSALRVLTEQ
jgi:hypothetical protein